MLLNSVFKMRSKHTKQHAIDEKMTQYAIDGKFLPFMYEGLSEGLLKKAEEELNETEDKKKKGLARLREFVKKENLPKELDDEHLLRFLRVGKYDAKKSEDRLRNYCNTRRKKKDYIDSLDEKKVRYILDNNLVGILPYRDMHGRAIFYAKALHWDPEKCEMMDLFTLFYALTLFALTIPATTVSGICFLADARIQHTSHYFTVLNIYKDNLSYLLSMPLRFKKADVLNINYVVHIVYAALRPFLPKKLTKRVDLHKDTYSSTICDPSILPEEFDGTMGPANNDHFKEKFLHYLKFLKSENSIF